MGQFHENLISPEQAGTLDGLFAVRVKRSPERSAYRAFDRDSKEWVSYRWRDMAEQIARWQQALTGEDLPGGARVAVQLRNCPEWVMFDQAAMSCGLVTVPLYTDDRPDNIAYILEEAGVQLLLVQDHGRWNRLAPVIPEDGPLKRVLLLDDGPAARQLAAQDARISLVADWLPSTGGPFRTRSGIDPRSLASIVYTSGTTGRPKGVMLSHLNMLSVAHGALTVIDCYEEDVFLSFLPLSHTLERTAGYYLPVMTGSNVAYARSVSQIAADLQTIRPSVLVAVPRIFERIHCRVVEEMGKKGAVALALFHKTVEVGWHRFEYQQGRAAWHPKLLLWPMLEKLVAGKITGKLGGRLRAAISGGAPLNEQTARVFIGLGVPLIQGYGLTETAPVVSVNALDDNLPRSVGPPIRGVEVAIGHDQELLVRGPGVMLGYWNNHTATAQVIDAAGWLHTGDQARIGKTGHIYITGRLKDILVLSNGEKIPPGDMELAITLDPLFEHALVVGEGHSYLSALLSINPESWNDFAAHLGLDPANPASLVDQKLERLIIQRVRATLKGFPGFAKIRRVHLSLEPWSVENGLLTPTLKTKRAKVLEHYADKVEALYTKGPAS